MGSAQRGGEAPCVALTVADKSSDVPAALSDVQFRVMSTTKGWPTAASLGGKDRMMGMEGQGYRM